MSTVDPYRSVPPPGAWAHHSSIHLRPAALPARMVAWLDRPSQRMALREIADDPHLLDDIGLTRTRRCAKPRALLAMRPINQGEETMPDPNSSMVFRAAPYVNIVRLVLTHKEVPSTFTILSRSWASRNISRCTRSTAFRSSGTTISPSTRRAPSPPMSTRPLAAPR